MSRHLNAREVVDAAESTLDGRRARHLDSCERCRAQVAAVTSVTGNLRAGEGVPEPPEAFWSHLRTRVGAEVDAVGSEATGGWHRVWRVLAFAAPAVVALAVMIAPTHDAPVLPDVPPVVGAPAPGLVIPPPVERLPVQQSPDVWADLTTPSAGLPADGWSGVSPIRPGTAESLIEDLSADERIELLRLLRAEIGGGL